MKSAVILLNFGEPAEASADHVIPFLERIFSANAGLDSGVDPDGVRRRSRQLAEKRAPGLIADYNRIGGSPLVPQATAQALALRLELERRHCRADVYVAYQFIEPLIDQIVEQVLEAGVKNIVGFPYYPLCGFSTNVAAIRDLREAVESASTEATLTTVAGWHFHPSFISLWTDQIRSYAGSSGLRLGDPDTLLYFSAHGTPIKYLEAGSRYDRYVVETCQAIASALNVSSFELGYQNHSNRGIPWTQPDNETLIREIDAQRVVVVPISFMREQSETLSELDLDFRESVEDLGMEFFRVPVPHDAAALTHLVADLIEPLLRDGRSDHAGLAACRCAPGSFCTNGHRDL